VPAACSAPVDGREHRPVPTPPVGLKLRAASADDMPALCEIANDPGYRRGTLRLPYHSIEETRRWFAALTPDDRLIVAELDGQLVGNGGLHRRTGRRHHSAMLGLGLRDAFHGRGIGTALLSALIDVADNWLDIRRLDLTVYVDNTRAIALYERFGFVREGTLRADSFREGRYVDCLLMARLRGLP
jgi:L-phenylalanine/L-methionine N-acetyltransferase